MLPYTVKMTTDEPSAKEFAGCMVRNQKNDLAAVCAHCLTVGRVLNTFDTDEACKLLAAAGWGFVEGSGWHCPQHFGAGLGVN